MNPLKRRRVLSTLYFVFHNSFVIFIQNRGKEGFYTTIYLTILSENTTELFSSENTTELFSWTIDIVQFIFKIFQEVFVVSVPIHTEQEGGGGGVTDSVNYRFM